MHTNHLGDSGMKYSPGINIAQGKTPVIKENEKKSYIDKKICEIGKKDQKVSVDVKKKFDRYW